MHKLLDKIMEIKKENSDLRVYLGASKNKEKFYEKFGFIKRIDADLGYGMILTDNWIGEHYVANRIFRKIKWRYRWNY